MERLFVTGTGFQGKIQDQLRALVENNGGRYSGVLHRSDSTHLVCNSVLDAFGSEKYRRALQWGIPIVHYAWLLDSIAAGKLQDTSPYKTDPVEYRCTPPHHPSTHETIGKANKHHGTGAHGKECMTQKLPGRHATEQTRAPTPSATPSNFQPHPLIETAATNKDEGAVTSAAGRAQRVVLADSHVHNMQAKLPAQLLAPAKQGSIMPNSQFENAPSSIKEPSPSSSSASLVDSELPAFHDMQLRAVGQRESTTWASEAPSYSAPERSPAAASISGLDHEMEDIPAAEPMDSSPCMQRQNRAATDFLPSCGSVSFRQDSQATGDTPTAGLRESISGQHTGQQAAHTEASGSVRLQAGQQDMPSPVLWHSGDDQHASHGTPSAATTAAEPGGAYSPAASTLDDQPRAAELDSTSAHGTCLGTIDDEDDVDNDEDLVIPETQRLEEEPCSPYLPLLPRSDDQGAPGSGLLPQSRVARGRHCLHSHLMVASAPGSETTSRPSSSGSSGNCMSAPPTPMFRGVASIAATPAMPPARSSDNRPVLRHARTVPAYVPSPSLHLASHPSSNVQPLGPWSKMEAAEAASPATSPRAIQGPSSCFGSVLAIQPASCPAAQTSSNSTLAPTTSLYFPSATPTSHSSDMKFLIPELPLSQERSTLQAIKHLEATDEETQANSPDAAATGTSAVPLAGAAAESSAQHTSSALDLQSVTDASPPASESNSFGILHVTRRKAGRGRALEGAAVPLQAAQGRQQPDALEPVPAPAPCPANPPGSDAAVEGSARPAEAAAAAAIARYPDDGDDFMAPRKNSNSSMGSLDLGPKRDSSIAATLQAFAKLVPAARIHEAFQQHDHVSARHPAGRSAESALPISVDVLKQLARGTKGNSVKERHCMPSTKAVLFAEQLQVVAARPLLLNLKDKAQCVVVGRRRSDGSVSVVLAEPFCLYKLPDGQWWLEYHRFLSLDDLAVLGPDALAAVTIPDDFSSSKELLKSLERHHCRMSYVLGGVKISKVKKTTSRRKYGDSGFFWRYAFDPVLQRVVTDQSAADFVAN